ncbi:MAG: thermonuclease family protein [Candidatus Woesebacteria bacterium]
MNKYLHYIVLFISLADTLFGSGSKIDLTKLPAPTPTVLALSTNVPDGYVKVLGNADGDTIYVLLDGKKETVRLLGVDTPETKDPRRSVMCFGHQASDYTRSLVTDKAVKLIPDSMQTDRDKYGRLLRYVQFEDGTTLNEKLVYEGYAFAYEAYPDSKLEDYKKLEADAREKNRGLWGGCEVTIKNKGKSKSTQSVKE